MSLGHAMMLVGLIVLFVGIVFIATGIGRQEAPSEVKFSNWFHAKVGHANVLILCFGLFLGIYPTVDDKLLGMTLFPPKTEEKKEAGHSPGAVASPVLPEAAQAQEKPKGASSELASREQPFVSASKMPDSLGIVRSFYSALGKADGVRANEFVVYEKRNKGAYKIEEMERFYRSLQEPIRITNISGVNPYLVRVDYHYVARGGNRCDTTADVMLAERDGIPFIAAISAKC